MKLMNLVVVAAIGGLLACSQSSAAEKEPAKAPAVAAIRAARIVFIDKEKPCACTQKKIDASWAALQAGIASAKLPVERIHFDTQSAQAQPYQSKRPVMALPALYFLDSKGEVLEMLQGEVTEAQVRGAMK